MFGLSRDLYLALFFISTQPLWDLTWSGLILSHGFKLYLYSDYSQIPTFSSGCSLQPRSVYLPGQLTSRACVLNIPLKITMVYTFSSFNPPYVSKVHLYSSGCRKWKSRWYSFPQLCQRFTSTAPSWPPELLADLFKPKLDDLTSLFKVIQRIPMAPNKMQIS